MHYSFHKDLAVGENYEQYIIDRFTRLNISCRRNWLTNYESKKAFDLLIGHALVEVKFDFMSEQTGNCCFETDLLITPSHLIIYGLPVNGTVYNHIFTRTDIWRFAANKYPRKFVGDGKRTETIIVPKAQALKWGKPLTTLENELCKLSNYQQHLKALAA